MKPIAIISVVSLLTFVFIATVVIITSQPKEYISEEACGNAPNYLSGVVESTYITNSNAPHTCGIKQEDGRVRTTTEEENKELEISISFQ